MATRDYTRIEKEFRRVFEVCAPALALDSVENVRHYLDVAELEMAYESFVLSVLDEQVELSDADRRAQVKLMRSLRRRSGRFRSESGPRDRQTKLEFLLVL